ncbi:MAG: DNA/RNA non-specific endonuclease [Ignavibacteriaceae bacterium]
MLRKSLFLLIIIAGFAFPQKGVKGAQYGLKIDSVLFNHLDNFPLEIPNLRGKDDLIFHTGYSLLYNEEHEQANWVAYNLTAEKTVSVIKRGDKFIPDPKVVTGSAENQDYFRSGFDKGHLAPAADMGYSEVTMRESFYFSNMSPQNPSFNRGIWEKLEEQVREWAVEYKSVLIVTGPVLEVGLKTIGKNKVSVPDYFYKVILDTNSQKMKGVGFIIPNKKSQNTIGSFAVTIDSVESMTGLDFYPLLPDSVESKVESQIMFTEWGITKEERQKKSKIKKR